MTDSEIIQHLLDFPGIQNQASQCQTLEETKVFYRWLVNTWNAAQGTYVPVAKFMGTKEAAALTSFVCQEKAHYLSKGGVTEIRKAAEIRGSRFNTGKLRFDLIDGLAMEGLAAVLTKGAEKYAAENWRSGMPVSECIASLERHLNKLKRGENIDSETGLPHIDHIQCNAMFISNMLKTRPDMDDRHVKAMDLRDRLANTPEQVAAAFVAGTKSS